MARSRRQKRQKPRLPPQALPTELVEHIVGYLEPDERRCALARLIRVSKGFLASAQWLLYERIQVQFDNVEQPREEGDRPSLFEGSYSDNSGWESPFWTVTRGSAACLGMLSKTARLAALVRRFEARGPQGSWRASAILWPTDYNLLDRALAALAPHIQHLTVRVALLCPQGRFPSSFFYIAFYHKLQLPCKMPRLTNLDWRSDVSIGMRGQDFSGPNPLPFPSLRSLALGDISLSSSFTPAVLIGFPTLALTHLALHYRLQDKHLAGLCQLVAPTLTSLVLDYYHCAPRDYWHEKAYGDDNLPFLPLRRLKSVTVVLRHQTTELNVIGGFVSWPTAGEATFQADFDHLCDLLGTLPRENPVVPKLRLPPLIPAHFRELDHEFWTKVFKERKKPERADQARRVDSSLA